MTAASPALRPGGPPLRLVRTALRDLLVEVGYRSGLTLPRRALRGRLNVVTFHRVLPPELAREYPIDTLVVTTDEFAWFLRLFEAHFSCTTLRDAHGRWSERRPADKPWLAITFDDGQRDNYEFARPLLERSGIAATFFVPTDAVERGEPLWHDRLAFAVVSGSERRPAAARALASALGAPPGLGPRQLVRRALDHAKGRPETERVAFVRDWESRLGGTAAPAWCGMMSWPQVRELAGGGHEIGSHTCSHAILTTCEDTRLAVEVARSREVLQDRCGTLVDSFCYPNGGHDARCVEAVRRAGYARAVTTRWGPNGAGASPLTLHRCDIQGRTSRSTSGSLSEARVAWRLAGFLRA